MASNDPDLESKAAEAARQTDHSHATSGLGIQSNGDMLLMQSYAGIDITRKYERCVQNRCGWSRDHVDHKISVESHRTIFART